MEKISWTDRVRNEVLHRVKEERNIVHIIHNSFSTKLSEHEDGRDRLKHVVFLAIKHHNLAIYYSCVF